MSDYYADAPEQVNDDGYEKCMFVTDGGKTQHGRQVGVILTHDKVEEVINYIMTIRDM